MNYQDILKQNPRFKMINNFNITDRLQAESNNDLFVVYDTIKATYELHSVKSYMITGFSHNATIDQSYINGYLVNDFKANNLKKFALDIQDRNQKLNYLYDLQKDKNKSVDLLKLVERTIGTKV